MVATTDLWVYNAENFCVSFFYHVTFIFHLRGGKIKKKVFLGLPSMYNQDVNRWRGMRNGMGPECPVSVEGGPSLNSSERRDGTVNFESRVDFNLNFSDNVCIELPTRDMLWIFFVPTYLSATSATYISYIFWLPIALWQYLTMNNVHWTWNIEHNLMFVLKIKRWWPFRYS